MKSRTGMAGFCVTCLLSFIFLNATSESSSSNWEYSEKQQLMQRLIALKLNVEDRIDAAKRDYDFNAMMELDRVRDQLRIAVLKVRYAEEDNWSYVIAQLDQDFNDNSVGVLGFNNAEFRATLVK